MGYPENQYVNFAIIRRNPKAMIYSRYIFLVFLILTGTGIFGHYLPSFLQSGIIGTCLVVLLFFGIMQSSIKLYDKIGWIMMYPEFVAVRMGDVEVEYPIETTTRIALELQGYKGQPIFGRHIRTRDGINNFITLSNAAGTVRHEVLISNAIKITIMERLFDHYRSSGVEVKQTNRSSTDSILEML